MKTRISIFFGLIGILLLVTSCSSPQKVAQQQVDGTPGWFMSPLEDTDEYMYATGSFVSSRRNIAQSRASLAANQALAVKLGTIIENLQEDFYEEITSGERANYNDAFTNAVRQVTNQKLIGVTQENLAFVPQESGSIEAFILVRMPVGEAKASLLNALSQDEEMYVRFQRSQAFERMDQSMKQYYGENTPK